MNFSAPFSRYDHTALSLRSGRLTGLMRKFARLANFPNFFRCAPETSLNRDLGAILLGTTFNSNTIEVIEIFI